MSPEKSAVPSVPDGGARPERTRTYQNHHLDSTRWDRLELRPDDVIIATPYKSGTTWMQAIVGTLVLPDEEQPLRRSPWPDSRLEPIDELVEKVAAQEHRRFLKTHLPLDGIRWDPELRYVVVGRDPRDVFMSLWNHYSGYKWGVYAVTNGTPGRVGDPLPRCPDDVRDFWEGWIGRGWFPWESDGYPFWSAFRTIGTWWRWRHLENLLFVHYADLLADPAGEVRRVADHLGVAADEDRLHEVVERTSFDRMRADAIAREEQRGGPNAFRNDARTHYNKGTNGRWRQVLTEDDLADYRRVAERELAPECIRWLEGGRAAFEP